MKGIKKMERLIHKDKTVIVACDVPTLKKLEELINKTHFVPGIGGYKIGSELVERYGLPEVMEVFANLIDLPVIYDKQKAGTDIPKLGENFALNCKNAMVDAVILFPFAGAETEREWIKACQEKELTVLVGAHMTQPEFLWGEGGFIADEAPVRMFKIAMENGVRDFVVPGNKVEFVKKYHQLFINELGKDNFTLYAPGFVGQGGVIAETGKVAGKNWHAIVGSAIYTANDIETAARQITSQLY